MMYVVFWGIRALTLSRYSTSASLAGSASICSFSSKNTPSVASATWRMFSVMVL